MVGFALASAINASVCLADQRRVDLSDEVEEILGRAKLKSESKMVERRFPAERGDSQFAG